MPIYGNVIRHIQMNIDKFNIPLDKSNDTEIIEMANKYIFEIL